MALHGAGRAGMVSAMAGQPLNGLHRWRGLYTAAPAVLRTSDQGLRLAAHTLAWTDAADAGCTNAPRELGPWTLTDSTGPAWWLTLET
jgi:hypothetical protein